MDKELYDKLKQINDKMKYLLNDTSYYSKLYNLEKEQEQAEKELAYINEQKEKAIGDPIARNYIISQYSKFLNSDVMDLNEDFLNQLINSAEINKNSPYILYEMLLELYGIKELILKYKLPHIITDDEIKNIAAAEVFNLKEHFSKRFNKITLIARLLYAHEYGQAYIDSLQYQDISEIGISNKNYAYIAIGSDKYYLKFINFVDDDTIINIQKKATAKAKAPFDQYNIAVTTAKDNGSRVTVSGYDFTDAGQLYYNERIFNLKKVDLKTMRDELKTIDDRLYQFIQIHMRGKGTFMITGPDMGVGKSTFMLSMLGEIPQKYGIGIIDPPNEMQAQQKFPLKNIATLIPNEKVGVQGSFKHILKMARDYLFVSEITDPAEMGELMNVFLRLNAGGGSTLHSLNPYEVVPNTRNLLLNTPMYQDRDAAETDIARGLDLIFHLIRLSPNRIVLDKVVEIIPLEYDSQLEPLLEGSYRERFSNLVNLLQLKAHRALANKNYRYSTIFEYDREQDCWQVKNPPSKRYIEKIGVHVPQEEIRALMEALREGVYSSEGNTRNRQ